MTITTLLHVKSQLKEMMMMMITLLHVKSQLKEMMMMMTTARQDLAVQPIHVERIKVAGRSRIFRDALPSPRTLGAQLKSWSTTFLIHSFKQACVFFAEPMGRIQSSMQKHCFLFCIDLSSIYRRADGPNTKFHASYRCDPWKQFINIRTFSFSFIAVILGSDS